MWDCGTAGDGWGLRMGDGDRMGWGTGRGIVRMGWDDGMPAPLSVICHHE